jgi:hemoglobin
VTHQNAILSCTNLTSMVATVFAGPSADAAKLSWRIVSATRSHPAQCCFADIVRLCRRRALSMPFFGSKRAAAPAFQSIGKINWQSDRIEQVIVCVTEVVIKSRQLTILGASLAILLTASANPANAAITKSLYQRLGGKAAITAVVNEFLMRVAADSRVNKFFAHADIPLLKTELADEICRGSGGACKYSGKSMKDAHRGMGVSGADFNALVEDLVEAPASFASRLVGR